ncbi:MAG: hypothetical protein WA637_18790 [Terriglobales bacterium]
MGGIPKWRLLPFGTDLGYELQQRPDRLRFLLDINNRVASHLELRLTALQNQTPVAMSGVTTAAKTITQDGRKVKQPHCHCWELRRWKQDCRLNTDVEGNGTKIVLQVMFDRQTAIRRLDQPRPISVSLNDH